ncbi:MAG: acetylxylan esterase [Bacteroidales bacterium]|nr:acetylxylan esterase [Bacteroidales bacterium]
MIKKLPYFFVSALLAMAVAFACTPAPAPENETPEENQEPENQQPAEEDLQPFTFSVTPGSENYIFQVKPTFTLHLNNPNKVAATAEISFVINTDKSKKVLSRNIEKEVPANGSADVTLTTEEILEPGFYKATGKVGRKSFLAARPFGIDPFQIDSAPDMQPDFAQFWEDAYNQLKAIDLNENFIQTSRQGTYLVEMQSIPDGLEGEPVTIRCYYIEPPKDGSTHPVIVHYYGYDDFPGTTMLELPSGNAEFAHLWLSTRGQRINARAKNLRQDGIDMDFVNPYDKQWFTVNFGDKDSYYYRGAYMDCVQGIRFLALSQDSRVKGRIDMDNVFVEGMSQGGAFSYAAASLSKEYPVRAIAAAVAFMGDFPDYFTIVPNEGGGFPGMAQNCKKALGWTDTKMYEFMSYFDTKNLATTVSCPIIAAIGLQDNICPPHTNIAPYNNALTPEADKQMTFYPDMGHAYPSGWDSGYIKFFKAHMNRPE